MYTTVSKVRAEMKVSVAGASDDALILGYIADVTKRLKRMTYDFEPFYDTKYLTANFNDVNLGYGFLSLMDASGPLLLASNTDAPTIVSAGTTFAYGSDVYAWPRNITPIRTLRLNDANGALFTTWYALWNSTQFMETIQVTGYWGYRSNYAIEGWLASGDSVQDGSGISASATTVTVTAVNGTDYYFQSPRFSPGNLIRVDNEIMQIWASADNTHISVRRGLNGTTAVAHAQNAAINVWYPEDDIVRAATRWSAYLYNKRSTFEQVSITGIATVAYPNDCPPEVWATLQGYNNQ